MLEPLRKHLTSLFKDQNATNAQPPMFITILPQSTHGADWTLNIPEDYKAKHMYKNYSTIIGRKSTIKNEYLNTISFFSELYIPALMDTLNEFGINQDNTAFMMIADHGMSFGLHRKWWNHHNPYEENMRLFNLFFGKNIPSAGQVMPGLWSQTSVMPTILDLLQLSLPDEHLAPSFFHETTRPLRRIHCACSPPTECIISYEDELKVIENFKEGTSTLEVFDIEKDLDEMRNLWLQPNKSVLFVARVNHLADSGRAWRQKFSTDSLLPIFFP